MPAHPRSRGENALVSRADYGLGGSSPLTRGKQRGAGVGVIRSRLIPAHAGKTAGGGVRDMPPPAHPRSRGENSTSSSQVTEGRGSSPLTRGKPNPPHNARNRGRLIPAHAGKTPAPHARRTAEPAHPRSRGENLVMSVVGPSITGSSPLTRGKPVTYDHPPLRNGLIPAHAGKTISEHANSDPAQAHPRSRGENSEISNILSSLLGSSPLTRGKQSGTRYQVVPKRLIPAHAGKTWSASDSTLTSSAHPRSRGENTS